MATLRLASAFLFVCQTLVSSNRPLQLNLDPARCLEAVLVEPRALPYTSMALQSALRVPGIDLITLAHGKDNAEFARQLVQREEDLADAYNRGFLDLLPLSVGDLGGDDQINEIPGSLVQQKFRVQQHLLQRHSRTDSCAAYHLEYSRLLLSPGFWGMLRCDRVLTFQSDTVFCRGSQVSIAEFQQYSYVGGETPGIDRGPGRIHMNGGFALRSRPAMLQCIKEEVNTDVLRSGLTLEDGIYSGCRSLKQPPMELVERFAVDNGNKLPSAAPLGVHKPWAGRYKDELNQLCDGAQALTEAALSSANNC